MEQTLFNTSVEEKVNAKKIFFTQQNFAFLYWKPCFFSSKAFFGGQGLPVTISFTSQLVHS